MFLSVFLLGNTQLLRKAFSRSFLENKEILSLLDLIPLPTVLPSMYLPIHHTTTSSLSSVIALQVRLQGTTIPYAHNKSIEALSSNLSLSLEQVQFNNNIPHKSARNINIAAIIKSHELLFHLRHTHQHEVQKTTANVTPLILSPQRTTSRTKPLITEMNTICSLYLYCLKLYSAIFLSTHKNQISCDIRTHSLAPVHRYRPSFGCNKFSTRNNASILLNHTPPPLDGLWCGIRFVPFAVTAISSSLSNEIEHETGPRRCAIKLHFVHRSANGIGLRLMFLVLLFFLMILQSQSWKLSNNRSCAAATASYRQT